MKTGLALNELAVELQRRAESSEDYVADTRTIGFAVETIPLPSKADEEPRTRNVPVLTIDGVESPTWYADGHEHPGSAVAGFRINDHAQNQVAQRLGIPFRFFERMRDSHPDILQDTVGKLFNREPERRMIRTLDEGARAFLSDRYRRIDNYDVAARAVFPALAEADQGYQVMSAGLTDTRMYVKLIWPDITGTVKDDGDSLHPGVVISNSEVGAGAFSVEPFTFRDFCTNGCIWGLEWADEWGMRRQHVGRRVEAIEGGAGIFSDETMKKDDEALLAMASDMVKAAASQVQFERMLDRLRELAGLKVDGDPVVAVERLAKATGLQEGEQASVMAHLIEGGDLTRYGFWNAVTRTAEDVASYDRATELERIGGKVAAWNEREWKALAAA